MLSADLILIQQRALGKYHTPGLWANACCTHPGWEEDPADCAVRRLDEELGVVRLDLHHRGQVEYCADAGGGLVEHELVDMFVTEDSPGLPMNPDPAEVMATRWIALPTLLREIGKTPDAFTPWLRIYLAEHAEMILGGRCATA